MKNQYLTRSSMFWSLFKYISGQNDSELELEMTAPVLIVFENVDSNNTIDENTQVMMTMKYMLQVNRRTT